jgi:hypothetical protein
MRQLPGVLAFALLFVLAAACPAAEIQQKWIQVGVNFADSSSVDNMIAVMQTAKLQGCTHVTFRDSRFGFIEMLPQSYIDNCARARVAAQTLGLTLVPGVFPFGYSGGYLVHDTNLAAGLPVKDAPFKVSGGHASADPTAIPTIANAGFDTISGGIPAGWDVPAALAGNVKADTVTKHGGAASLCEYNLGSLPPDSNGNCIVTQTVTVKPYQYYLFKVWCKTSAFSADEFRLFIRSHGGKRDHCYTSLPVGYTQDWTLCQVTFNTLDTTEISIGFGAETCYSGTIWWDDISIQPAGLANVLRTGTKPFKVTSLDKRTTYVEGRDFKTVRDPFVGPIDVGDGSVMPMAYDIWHPGPTIELTPKSRIMEGQTLLVSFYHPHVVYYDQVSISLEDPAVFDIMDRQMRKMHQVWNASAYFMAYDEIRVGGWEVQPHGAHLTPGQLLARNVQVATAIAHKYAPRARLYTWSDMFDPYHNADPFPTGGYYLCRTGWDGSWRGLAPAVGVVNWIGLPQSMQWFGRRGHQQVMAGYYDGDPASNVAMWVNAAHGVPHVDAMMYTTWGNNFGQLATFFQLVDAANWK